jgi:outer membrane protein assembly factor BamB
MHLQVCRGILHRGLVTSAPAVVNGVVYFGSYDKNVYALDASTGVEKWSFATESVVASSPAVVDGRVFVGSFDNNTYALNADTGALIWKVETGYDQCVQASPAVANGIVYTGGAFDFKLYALDAANGNQKWTFTANGGITTAPAVIGNKVYFTATLSNTTYAVNAQNGNKIWSYQTNGNIYSSPAVVKGVTYFGAYDGTFYAVGQNEGTSGTATSPTTYYIITVVVAIVLIIIAVAVIALRKKRNYASKIVISFFVFYCNFFDSLD